MMVVIDYNKCNGCGVCVEICPTDALRLNNKNKPFMKYDECWYCGCCELECPKKALTMEIPYLIS